MTASHSHQNQSPGTSYKRWIRLNWQVYSWNWTLNSIDNIMTVRINFNKRKSQLENNWHFFSIRISILTCGTTLYIVASHYSRSAALY